MHSQLVPEPEFESRFVQLHVSWLWTLLYFSLNGKWSHGWKLNGDGLKLKLGGNKGARSRCFICWWLGFLSWQSMNIYICNLRVDHLSQVGNSRPDFLFSKGLGEDGTITTIGSKCQTSQQGHRKEGMMKGNRCPVTDEICRCCFYQLSVTIIMLHNTPNIKWLKTTTGLPW